MAHSVQRSFNFRSHPGFFEQVPVARIKRGNFFLPPTVCRRQAHVTIASIMHTALCFLSNSVSSFLCWGWWPLSNVGLRMEASSRALAAQYGSDDWLVIMAVCSSRTHCGDSVGGGVVLHTADALCMYRHVLAAWWHWPSLYRRQHFESWALGPSTETSTTYWRWSDIMLDNFWYGLTDANFLIVSYY